nr:MAG TPA: hypothetical protein [Caudoviricetes sp.]
MKKFKVFWSNFHEQAKECLRSRIFFNVTYTLSLPFIMLACCICTIPVFGIAFYKAVKETNES